MRSEIRVGIFWMPFGDTIDLPPRGWPAASEVDNGPGTPVGRLAGPFAEVESRWTHWFAESSVTGVAGVRKARPGYQLRQRPPPIHI